MKYDPALKPLTVSYPSFANAKLANNGHSVQFLPDPSDNSSGTRYKIFYISTKLVDVLLGVLTIQEVCKGVAIANNTPDDRLGAFKITN